MLKRFACIAAGSLVVAVAPADAATIIYTVTGANLAVGGQTYSNSTLTAIGDTDTAIEMFGDTVWLRLSSLTVSANGQSYVGSRTSYQFFTTTFGVAGFSLPEGNDIFDFRSSAFTSYDGISNLSTAVTQAGSSFFDTDGGSVQVFAGAATTFSASLSSAVPEPATWAMFICGFGLIGSTLRANRRKVAVSFA